MKLIIGLGNPGKKYESTRHNAGFLVLDALANFLDAGSTWVSAKHSNVVVTSLHMGGSKLVLAKPQTFMNSSGVAVSYLSNYYKINPSSDLLLIHDDLDIALGRYKLQFSKGPREHNGVTSVEDKLGKSGFWRLRVGIESREPYSSSSGKMVKGEKFVLQSFSSEEIHILEKTVTAEIIPTIEDWVVEALEHEL